MTLFGDRWPADGTRVVLLHSGITDRRCWYDLVDSLPPLCTVVAYDMRGFGDTAATADKYSHVDDLFAVLDELACGPVWIVGSSLGGGVALDAALLAPERVEGLVLIAPAVSGAPQADRLDANTAPLVQLLETADAASDLIEINRIELRIWLDGPGEPEGRISGATRELATAMNAAALRNRVTDRAGASGLDTWSRLDEIQTPTVVACGDLDVPFMVERCRELATRLPNARCQIMEGVAHLPYLEQPAMVADVLMDALRSPHPGPNITEL